MKVLVDSSVWIDYFRWPVSDAKVDFLIDENLVVVNDLMIAQHAIQNNLELYTRDKYFASIARHVPLSLL